MRGLADPGEDMGSLSGGVRGLPGAGVGGRHESCVKQEGSARHGVGSGRPRQRERLKGGRSMALCGTYRHEDTGEAGGYAVGTRMAS